MVNSARTIRPLVINTSKTAALDALGADSRWLCRSSCDAEGFPALYLASPLDRPHTAQLPSYHHELFVDASPA